MQQYIWSQRELGVMISASEQFEISRAEQASNFKGKHAGWAMCARERGDGNQWSTAGPRAFPWSTV